VGDIESAPFIEAMRQFQFRVGHDNFALIHVSLVPDMHGEQKTKPTQTTVHALRGLGLLPDLVCLESSNATVCQDLRSFCVDCVSVDRSSTARSGHQGKDIHVLSCVFRTSLWCARCIIGVPCPASPPSPGCCRVPQEAVEFGRSEYYERNAGKGRHACEEVERDYDRVRQTAASFLLLTHLFYPQSRTTL
jgi:hypothetical protein